MNKYQALKHNDGRMLAVVWPKEPIQKDFYLDISNAKLWQEDDRKYFDAMIEFEKACEQAIANGVPFKEQSDIDKIRKAIKIKEEPNFKQFGWEMEKMNPYPLPEGLELEIRVEDWKGSPIVEQKCQFAFIKKQPDRNDEIQDDLWQEAIKLWLHSETLDELKYRFRIERIKK